MPDYRTIDDFDAAWEEKNKKKDDIVEEQEAEEVIEENGALAATIAIIDGEIVVGLTKEEITFIADPNNKVAKVSRRDLPVI